MKSTILFGVLAGVSLATKAIYTETGEGKIMSLAETTRAKNSATVMTKAGKKTVLGRQSSLATPKNATDINNGFKVLYHDNLAVSIYVDASIAQPSRTPPYLVSSSGSNGAAPLLVTANVFGSFTPAWSFPGDDTITATAGSTLAALTCSTNQARTDVSCTVQCLDVATGKSKWAITIPHAIPAEGQSVAITQDGAFISILTTDFVAPLPTKSFNTVLRTFSTQSGTPLHTHSSANQTQAIDVSSGVDVVGIVSSAQVEIFSVSTGSVAYTHSFDFTTASFCLSPNGQFYAYGFETFYLYERVGTSNTYEQVDAINPAYSGQFFGGSCAFSPKGTTLATAWYRSDFLQNLVASYNTAAKNFNYWYPYAEDVGSIYQDLPVASAFDSTGKWFVVGTWGSSNATSPTVALFEANGKHAPVATYCTTGSVFSVDILTDSRNGNVYVASSGKHVHANMMGDGGDLYALQAISP